MRRVVLALYWAACFTATHVPVAVPPEIQYRFTDTVAHASMYGLLGVLFALAVWRAPVRRASLLKAALLLAAYGAFDELTQLLVDRHAEVADWAADAAGALAGLAACNAWRARKGIDRGACRS